MLRLLKCGPWHPGGWDPVPERKNNDDPCVSCAAEASDEVKRSA
ncbi:hypothetical protein AS9A_4584 [Hoyosella subflava DQS3-9A1]|uniref:Uncharacterized protein n=2 Tax=Hoyosella TaxID=697025 RepID=F6EPG7_HOYSD|nr:hypothetical protein AS9A_4584 [Hoyosella subflava DQS3-9A1]